MVRTGTTRMAILRRHLLDYALLAATAMIVPGGSNAGGATGPQIGDMFVTAAAPQGPSVRASSVRVGAPPILAWPRDPETGLARNDTRLNQVLLLQTRDANRQPGQLLGFSAICPHAACLVSQWVSAGSRLRCPCHDSEFDATHAGTVVAGPSPFPLPLLPVQTVKDLLIVAGPFSAPPGGHTTRTM